MASLAANAVGIGPAGRGAVALELVGVGQGPGGGSAHGQVVGVQIGQGALRLGENGFCIVLGHRHGGPNGGDMADQVTNLVVRLDVPQRGLRRLQLLLHAGHLLMNSNAEA